MATVRRLSDADVRTIFESVHHNRHPPAHLHFQIVPVGPDGLRLSPPSYEFEDGLYILMKPQKKKAPPSEQPKVPSHLMDYVMHEVPPAKCPWSLSGPQFPQPTAIQQRYCYPKGDPEYSSRKGGALWTMYGTDGKENMEYRLLHVYFSAKRAVNKGLKIKNPAANKRIKRAVPPRPPRTFAAPQPPPPAMQQPPMPRLTLPPPPPPQQQQPSYMASPARDCNSPLSFEISPPSPTMSPMFTSGNFVSPHVFSSPGGTLNHSATGSPFRPRVLVESHRNGTADGMMEQAPSASFDNDFHLDARSMQELEDACWNEPLFAPLQHEGLESLEVQLQKMQTNVRESILAAPESEQAPLLSLFTNWARQVAEDPLNADTATDTSSTAQV